MAGDASKELGEGGRARKKGRRSTRKGREEGRGEDGGWARTMEWIQLSLRVSWLVDVWLSARESLERDGYLFLLGEIFSRRDTGCFKIYIVSTNEQGI